MAVYRNEETLSRIHRMLLMLTLVGLAGGAVGLIRAAISGVGPALFAGITLAVTGLICLALMRRSRSVAIETDGDGVVTRSLFSTRRFAWSQIASFEDGARRRGYTQAFVRTVDGHEHALSAAGDPGPTCSRILKALGRELKGTERR